MTHAPTATDYVSAPKDYAELFQTYYLYVVNLVNKHGIHENNKEDVASDILTRFMERGFLEKFDPTLTFEHNGTARPARFKQFLSKFVLAYVMGHCDKQTRIARRERQIIDQPVEFPQSYQPSLTPRGALHSVTDSHEDAVLDAIMEEALAVGLRNYLTTIPLRSPTDMCDLPALFDAVRAQALDKGFVDTKALTELFGVGSTAMHTWIWILKAHIADHLGLPLPAKRPRTPRATQP